MSFFERLAEKLDLDDFDKRHKHAFVILALAIILIIVLWIWQLNKNITNPLYGGLNLKSLQTSSNQTSADDTALKNKDTDGDGLSDYDEINIYKTNPYLADSDGDGVSDSQEIKNGTDPNCPAGQQCTTNTDSNSSPSSFTNENLVNALNQVTPTATPTTTQNIITNTATTKTDKTGLTTDEKNALKTILGNSSDPATLRNFLLQSGADKNYVNSLSDQDLQKAINELLK